MNYLVIYYSTTASLLLLSRVITSC